VHVIRLQGFLFFGTLNQLDRYIYTTVNAVSELSMLIIDFKHVDGIDYSATATMLKIKKMLNDKEILLLLCGLDKQTHDSLDRGGIFDELESMFFSSSSPTCPLVFDDLHEAIEWAENVIITDAQPDHTLLH